MLVDPVDTMKYVQVHVEVVGTQSIMNTEATTEVVGIMVDDPQGWFVLFVGLM